MQNEFSVRFLAQGEYNKNYLITDHRNQKVVLRMNFGSQIKINNQIKYEYQALKHLIGSQRTPKPLFLDDSRNYFNEGLLIENYLIGKPLNYQTDLLEAAKILASIHSLPITKATYHDLIVEAHICSDRIQESDRLLNIVRETNVLSGKQLKYLFYLDEWCKKNINDEYFSKTAPSIVNTEVNSHNFIINKDYGWLIDWEKPVISNPVQDLTQFLAITTTLWRSNRILTTDQVNGFLSNYSVLRGLDTMQTIESVNHYMPFLLLRALSWCANLIVTYNTKPIQNREIFNKCQEYFHSDFLEYLFRKYGIN